MIGQKFNEMVMDEFITFKCELINSQHALNRPNAPKATGEGHSYEYESRQMDEFYKALWKNASAQLKCN